MIEVIYKDEKQTAKGNEESFNLPKNIRQIGIPNEKYRIYIEDYVYTFLKKIAEKAEEEEKGAAAFTVVESDEKIPARVLDRIKENPLVSDITLVQL